MREEGESVKLNIHRPFMLEHGVMLMLGMAGAAVAQDNEAQQPSARQHTT
jgi:hypothetical protein